MLLDKNELLFVIIYKVIGNEVISVDEHLAKKCYEVILEKENIIKLLVISYIYFINN